MAKPGGSPRYFHLHFLSETGASLCLSAAGAGRLHLAVCPGGKGQGLLAIGQEGSGCDAGQCFGRSEWG